MLYRLSRFSRIHKALRRIAYATLMPLPMPVKYGALGAVLSRRLPYRLVQSGSTVVQVGAPWDVLRSGRSRAIHLARMVGPSGRVIVLEPEPRSARALRAFCSQNGFGNVTIVEKGAWSSRSRLRFLEDPSHPAANLVESVKDPRRNDLGSFNVIEIDVDTLDNILEEVGVSETLLVSITTNGSENEILSGMARTAGNVRYLATIGEGQNYPLLGAYGFSRLGGDDRGYTYWRS